MDPILELIIASFQDFVCFLPEIKDLNVWRFAIPIHFGLPSGLLACREMIDS